MNLHEIECKENFEVKTLTSFKIGGCVKTAYFPKTQQEFVFLLENLDNFMVLGNCTNVLFSSSGYNGNIIFTTKMSDYLFNGNFVSAACGVKGQMLSQKACENSLSGFEFMIGFPGTIGGEIYMNASAHGQSISDKLIRCCLYDKLKKEIVYKEKFELGFEYRMSCLQKNQCILLGAEFELEKGNQEDIKNLMSRNLASRKNIQPNLVYPNAGSVFKNPPNDSAGRLLEKAGGKLLCGNNVSVWQNHANFIVNNGNAGSEDVLDLMLKMYTAVKEKFTIELTPEIIFIGNKTEKEEEICQILYQKMQK